MSYDIELVDPITKEVLELASAIRTRIAEAILAERNACAKAVISRGMETKNGEWHGNNHAAASFAECILARD